MAKVNAPLLAFNGGEVSKDALARVDVEKLRLAAECQVNFAPTVIGAMSLRGGLGYLGSVKSDAAALLIPFVFGSSDTALLELTSAVLRIWDGDALVTRASVATVVTNGDFSSSAGWTLSATAGCTADINSSLAGELVLTATARGGQVSAERSVSIAAPDQATLHALRIVVTNGPVLFMCGTSSGGAELIARTSLDIGTHSLTFTPGVATVFVRFESSDRRLKSVNSITIESAGVLELPVPWTAADLDFVRFAQSGDIIYVACDGYQQRKIERRSNNSWSIVLYESDSGPFSSTDTNGVTLTPSTHEGLATLTASKPLFRSTDFGRLFRIFTPGQTKQSILGAAGAVTEAVRVAGVGSIDRAFSWVRSGTWAGTLELERSVESATAGFKPLGATQQATTNGTTGADDSATHNNVVAWYRVKFKTYTSGAATVSFTGTSEPEGPPEPGGGVTAASGSAGICHVISYSSPTLVTVQVISPFSSIAAANDWQAGKWSTGSGWPSAVALFQGRLWWAMADSADGSVSDDYQNFDDTVEGEAAPISRTLGSTEVEIINWLLPLRRLVAGCEGSEIAIRSSSFDEPLTNVNAMPDACSTQGSDNLPALKLDNRGIFVEKSGRRVFELAYSVEVQDYTARDLTRLNSKIGVPGFVATAAQRQPDTNLHFVRGDGQDALLLREPNDEVSCWTRAMTLGVIERVAVLPGDLEDSVYYVVRRVINGATKRFLEKQARRDQCVGGTLNHQADAYLQIAQASSTTVAGLSHLEGESVVVWANGKDLGSYTVAAGSIVVSEAVTSAIVGLGGVSFSSDTGSAVASVTVGTKYNGYPAEVFANRSTGGKLRYVGTVTVASGVVTLPNGKTAAKIVVYLGYYGLFRSAKLAYGAQRGTALNQRKKIDALGLVALDMHPQALDVGQTIDLLDDLPLVEEGANVTQTEVWDEYDSDITSVPGEWDTDARLTLLAQAPRPVTLSAVVLAVQTHERG